MKMMPIFSFDACAADARCGGLELGDRLSQMAFLLH